MLIFLPLLRFNVFAPLYPGYECRRPNCNATLNPLATCFDKLPTGIFSHVYKAVKVMPYDRKQMSEVCEVGLNSALDKFGTFLTMRENYDEKFNQIC